MTIKNFLVILILAAATLACSSVHAAESNAVVTPRDRVTLISDVDAAAPGKPLHIGLRFRMTKDWHIYWLNPGDAGVAPTVDVHAPDGTKVSEIEWPTPVRMQEGPAMVFAYQDDVTLPMEVTLPSSLNAKTVMISVDAEWLICASHCVPEKGHFELSLPLGSTTPSSQAPLFKASLARLPQASPFSAHVTPDDVLKLQGPALSSTTVADAWFFPVTWGAVVYSAPQELTFDNGGIALKMKRGPTFNPNAALAGILVLKDKTSHESYYSIEATAGTTNDSDWPALLLFAFLGGLILNLMPCVFPILAMKALSLVNLSGAARQHVRTQALFYTAGVLVAFTVIACILLALRTAGESIGWGFQFQSPVFVTFMAWLLFVLGLNLSGIFTLGTRLMGVGENYARHKGRMGSFFTGLLAVVVSTPCVAPFLGAAIAAAVTAPALGMLAIFLVMGVGLALPYVLLAVFPDAVRIMPRPGKWMELLRQGMAFPIYGAAAWLVWVVSCQDGTPGLAYVLSGTVTLAFSGWLYGQVRPVSIRGRLINESLIGVAILLAGFCLYRIADLPAASSAALTQNLVNEEPFTPARLKALAAADKPVFVDMTAAWCITCLVNEQVAISSGDVQAAFKRDQVAYLKGDWTQQDPEITQFLKDHGSDGVPLYVYYPPHHGRPLVLPQILTPSIILTSIDHPTS